MKRLIASIAVLAFAALASAGTLFPLIAVAEADEPRSVVPLAASYGFEGTIFPNTSPDEPWMDEGGTFHSANLDTGASIGVLALVLEDTIRPYVGTTPDLPALDGSYDIAAASPVGGNVDAKLDIVESIPAPRHDDGFFILPLPDVEHAPVNAYPYINGFVPQPYDTIESEWELAR